MKWHATYKNSNKNCLNIEDKNGYQTYNDLRNTQNPPSIILLIL